MNEHVHQGNEGRGDPGARLDDKGDEKAGEEEDQVDHVGGQHGGEQVSPVGQHQRDPFVSACRVLSQDVLEGGEEHKIRKDENDEAANDNDRADHAVAEISGSEKITATAFFAVCLQHGTASFVCGLQSL